MDMDTDKIYTIMSELATSSQNWESKEQDRHIKKKRETVEVFQFDTIIALTSQIDMLNKKIFYLLKFQNSK